MSQEVPTSTSLSGLAGIPLTTEGFYTTFMSYGRTITDLVSATHTISGVIVSSTTFSTVYYTNANITPTNGAGERFTTYISGTGSSLSFTTIVSTSTFIDSTTSATSSVPGNTSTGTSSSSLSTGAKIGIGVVVPLVAIIAAVLLFIYLRRRSRAKKYASTSDPNQAGTHATSDKPELTGSVYDPAIAGLVKPKSELSTSFGGSTTPSRVHTTILPSELAHNSAIPELGIAALPDSGGGAGAASTTVSDSKSGAGALASVSGSLAKRPTSAVVDGEAESLAEEADLLVQELGLIQMRKKALIGFAKGKGLQPEDLPGMRGEDYRDLLVREARIRDRIGEIDSARREGTS